MKSHVTMREHRASLAECDAAELRLLGARRCRPSCAATTRCSSAPFHTSWPYTRRRRRAARPRQGHLHVEFYPPLRTAEKLKYLAGSEQGAGTFVADVLPEESAAELREAIARAA